MASPTAVQKVPLQNTIFDLDSMSEVTVQKTFEFQPALSVADALARIGNDQAKLLELINEGLIGEQRAKERVNPTGWQVLNDEGETAGEFSGVQADVKKVNALVLTLAKTVFGYSKDLDAAGKASAKQSAMDMVKNTESIRNGLKKSAAITE